MRQLSHLLWG